MAGQVGRPRKAPGEPKSPYTKGIQTQPKYLSGFTGRSTEELFRVTPSHRVLIPVIEDEYRKVKRDPTQKIGELTLKYLRDHRIIKAEQYVLYRLISERPEERTMVIDRSVIEHVNNKFIAYYESL